jgi:hypothetical protein
MHHPPDLSLASSYIPACLCLFKCTIAFVLFIFAPVRGWIGLVSVLLTDRILWNQTNSAILDVNAVCVALVGGLMVMHARAEGIKTLIHFGVTGVWILLSSLQILNATRLHRAYEVLFAAFAVSVLSCMHQAPERTELLALRSFAFVVANVTLPYLGVMLQHPEIDTYVNACRTLLVLLGEPEVASAWAAVYVLCIGYQVRSTSAAGLRSHSQYTKYGAPYYEDMHSPRLESAVMLGGGGGDGSSSCCGAAENTGFKQMQSSTLSSAQQQHAQSANGGLNAASASFSFSGSQSEEATLLREALASRKGYRDA